jgi:uncharacterized linocin/CFP29 family protein
METLWRSEKMFFKFLKKEDSPEPFPRKFRDFEGATVWQCSAKPPPANAINRGTVEKVERSEGQRGKYSVLINWAGTKKWAEVRAIEKKHGLLALRNYDHSKPGEIGYKSITSDEWAKIQERANQGI